MWDCCSLTKHKRISDNIPSEFSECHAEWSEKFLCNVSVRSQEFGQIPEEWKLTKVILKIWGRTDLQLENSLNAVTYLHFWKPVGFSRAASWLSGGRGLRVMQLVHAVHDFPKILDGGGQGNDVFLGFADTFDCVCQQKLVFEPNRLLRKEQPVQ